MAKRRGPLAKVPQPLIVFLVAKVGLRDAVKVATFTWAWGRCGEVEGRVPNFRQYSEFWNQSEAQTYKELAVFHKVWPEDRTPQRVWEWMCDQVDATDRDSAVAQLLSATLRVS
jgi:hypothetical protein